MVPSSLLRANDAVLVARKGPPARSEKMSEAELNLEFASGLVQDGKMR